MDESKPDLSNDSKGRLKKPDKAAIGLALASVLTMLVGLVLGSAPVVVSGFIGLFLAASWFGLAF